MVDKNSPTMESKKQILCLRLIKFVTSRQLRDSNRLSIALRIENRTDFTNTSYDRYKRQLATMILDSEAKMTVHVDRGGTFTDCIGFYENKPFVVKLLSVDPSNYPDAPREGIRRLLELATGIPHPRFIFF